MKKNLFILAIAVIAFVPQNLLAQKKSKSKHKNKNDDEYSYKILRNDPANAKNLTIGFEPANIDINGINMSFGWGGNLS